MAARKPAARKPTAAKAPTEQPAEAADICRVCWPGGWPHQAETASCEHGSYSRDPEVAPPGQTPTTGPAGDGENTPEHDPEQPPAEDKTGA